MSIIDPIKIKGGEMIRNNLERSVELKNLYLRPKSEKTGDTKISETHKEEKVASDRISEIRDQIQSGSYKVDLKKTSEKMALNLLGL